MKHPLTVTGTYRSGTTLVERLLDQHPDVAVASQPLPHLWLAAKRAFLESRGITRAMPLGPLFRDPTHDPEGLMEFLSRWPTSPTQVLHEVLVSQDGFSGAMTPEVSRLLDADTPPASSFPDLVAWCWDRIATLMGRSEATVVGAKEIVIDEFVPVLLQAGHRVVIVVRDLRAIVASTLAGGAAHYVGSPRPMLFSVRSWRRSVATALAHASHSGLHVVRYEDLLEDTKPIVDAWAACGLDPSPGTQLDPAALDDPYGRPWRANTSFADRPRSSPESLHRALDRLDASTREYLEVTGGPELMALGYLDRMPPDAQAVLERFDEPTPISRTDFDSDYSTARETINEELKRLQLLTDDLELEQAQEWFVWPLAHQRLGDACRQVIRGHS